MKKMNCLQTGFAFAGCFLGAGYVSGQELWQFFGSFGAWGIAGLIVAELLIFAVGFCMLRINQITGLAEVDRVILPFEAPALRYTVMVLELVFLFGVCTIMAAGVGALAEQLFGIPMWVGCAVFTLLVSVTSLAGLGGMVKALSLSVPILVIVSLAFGVFAVTENGFSAISFSGSGGSNSLMGSWWIAAISFACYNVFGSIAMVSPLGQFVEGRVKAALGIFAGTVILAVIAGSVLISVCLNPECISAELPMLSYASASSVPLGYIYGILLLLAMFGTALSSMVAFTNLVSLKSERIKRSRGVFTLAYAAAMFCGSLFGFGGLISVVYPIFGYCSSAFIVLMAAHYFKVRRGSDAKQNSAA